MSDSQATAAEVQDWRDVKIRKLETELNHFRNSGIIEVAVRNAAVAEYMTHWESRTEKAEARIRELEAELADTQKALLKASATHVKNGTHVIVPVEPTEAMKEAAQRTRGEGRNWQPIAKQIYCAMIRAAQENADD